MFEMNGFFDQVVLVFSKEAFIVTVYILAKHRENYTESAPLIKHTEINAEPVGSRNALMLV